MIKVTFRRGTSIYWAVCEKIRAFGDRRHYELNNLMEDSMGRGPVPQVTIPANWKVDSAEMVKVTFQFETGGVYWAACKRFSNTYSHGYVLGDILEDSIGGAPFSCMIAPESWRIIAIEGV